MTSNQILPVNNQPTASGVGNKANGIVQIQQPQQSGAWILADNGVLYMNGTLVPSGGFQLNNIKADDLLCGVMCNNGGDLQLGSDDLIRLDSQNIQLNGLVPGISTTEGAFIQSDGGASSIQLSTAEMRIASDNLINILTAIMTVNTYKSSEYYISYGESKGQNETSQQYLITYPNPDIGQPDIPISMFGYPDVNSWYMGGGFNSLDNNFIIATGNTFRFVCPNSTAVEIEITWQLRYVFDGNNPRENFAIGLYNQSDDVIVPQSLTWMPATDLKYKWQTFKTSFMMSTTQQDFFPFFQNQAGNQWQDSDANGNQRSSIKFKFYQFVTY